jgi:hypothetical protein
MRRRSSDTDHIEILAMGESGDGERYLSLSIKTGRRRRRAFLSMRELQRSSREALANLDANLVTDGARREFLERAQQAGLALEPTFAVVTRPGWVGSAFVYPDASYLPSGARLAVVLPAKHRVYGAKFRSQGSLDGWKRIALLARGNSRLVLAIALAFAGPVVDLLKLEPPMIQLFGAPGASKTAIGLAAGSVWGGDDDGLFCETWNNTVNNLEPVAAAHHATFLVLDETRLWDEKDDRYRGYFKAVLRLAEGRTKGRWTDAASSFRSRAPVLSTSNASLDEKAREHGLKIDDAHRDRLIDVPLPLAGLGAFEELYGFADFHALAVELIRLAGAHHGVASEAFVDDLVEERARDDSALRAFLTQRIDVYMRAAARRVQSPGRDLTRVHRKFATIYAAASFAIRQEILPWSYDELGNALIACERAHAGCIERARRATTTAAREADPLERLKAYVRRRSASFVDLRRGFLDPTKERHHSACAGYVNAQPDGALEVLFPDARFNEICGGKAAALRAKAELQRRGVLLRDGRRPSTRRTIWASGARRREQVVALRASFFGAAGAAAE